MRRLIASFLLASSLAAPAWAQRPSPSAICAANAELDIYRFIADRPLTGADEAAIRTEALRHPDEANPAACRTASEIHAKTLTANPVARARLKAAMETGYYLNTPPGDARLVLLQRYAPVVLADRGKKLVMRRAAMIAYFDTVRFVAAQFGEPVPPDSVEHQVALIRPKLATLSPTAVRALTYEEARDEILKRDWAARPPAWRRQVLAAAGERPTGYDAIQLAAARVQEAAVQRRIAAGDRNAGGVVAVARRGASVQATGLKVQALLGAVAAGRP
jgi:hypothetical protein